MTPQHTLTEEDILAFDAIVGSVDTKTWRSPEEAAGDSRIRRKAIEPRMDDISW